jgi:preprotein translocase subunit SecF
MPNLEGKRHTLKDLYHERTNFNFLDRKWRWALLSGTIILAGVLAFALRGGLNLGIDFTGGQSWEVKVQGHTPSTSEIRSTVEGAGVTDPTIVIVGGNTIRVESKDVSTTEQDLVRSKLASLSHVDANSVSVNTVGPTWGGEVSRKAIEALIVFFFLIAIYLSVRFELKMAAAALVAVIHDILITVGVYAITGFEVTPSTVVAFLTILGFSLYDTVVVFDKIKENTPQLQTVKGLTYTQMANRSLNQVLMRSLNTSFVALMPVASLLVVGVWIYGALALRDFGLALFVGLLAGAYSSIFVATPLLAWWKELEPRNRALRDRSEARSGRLAGAAANAVPQLAPVVEEEEERETVDAGAAPRGSKRAAVGAASSASPPAPPSPSRQPGDPFSSSQPGITPRARQQRGKKRR